MSSIPLRAAAPAAAVAMLLNLGCSQYDPASPSAVATADTGASPQATQGKYILEFLYNGVVVTSAPAGSSPTIRAHITDASDVSADRGLVSFYVCSRGGKSLEQIDIFPYSDCDAGVARWIRIQSGEVNPGTCFNLGVGYACASYGVGGRRVGGFRIKYTPQGGPIAPSEAKANFTWQ